MQIRSAADNRVFARLISLTQSVALNISRALLVLNRGFNVAAEINGRRTICAVMSNLQARGAFTHGSSRNTMYMYMYASRHISLSWREPRSSLSLSPSLWRALRETARRIVVVVVFISPLFRHFLRNARSSGEGSISLFSLSFSIFYFSLCLKNLFNYGMYKFHIISPACRFLSLFG